MVCGKSWRELSASEVGAAVLIAILFALNAWEIYAISMRMYAAGTLQFRGIPFVVGPILLALRKIRLVGLYFLLQNKKIGFSLYFGSGLAEIITFIIFIYYDTRLMMLAMKLSGVAAFEMVFWIILVLIFTPIALRHLLSACWESMK